MELRTLRHQIANIKRLYNLQGQDILTCYDTAIKAHFGDVVPTHYGTVSVSPSNYDKLVKMAGSELVVKHPGSNVECIRFFDGKLYVRKEARVSDEDVEWTERTGCYSPTVSYLRLNLEAIIMSSKSTKKQVAYAQAMLDYLKMRVKNHVQVV